eukprot:1242432-Rhodomonas_salina.1
MVRPAYARPTRCHVLTERMVLPTCQISSTDCAYAPSRLGQEPLERAGTTRLRSIGLRLPYAKSGTHIAYPATRPDLPTHQRAQSVPPPYGPTHLLCDVRYSPRLWFYASTTRCPVLTYATAMRCPRLT